MIEDLLLKLRARDDVSSAEEEAMRAMVGEAEEVRADRLLVRAGQPLGTITLLLEGLASRYKDLRNGGRQITKIHVPGDFTDLHGFTLKRLDHNIVTLTPCRIATIPHERLDAALHDHPRLFRLFWLLTNLDAAINREWMLSLGRRDSVTRMAHLLCELRVRLEIVGRADREGFELALTQADLAECLGLTSVHVNRTLKQLREAGLADFRRGRVCIPDLAKLEAAADFDPAYLYLEKRRR